MYKIKNLLLLYIYRSKRFIFAVPFCLEKKSPSLLVLTYLNAVTGVSGGYYLIYADTAQNFDPQLIGALLKIFIKPISQP